MLCVCLYAMDQYMCVSQCITTVTEEKIIHFLWQRKYHTLKWTSAVLLNDIVLFLFLVPGIIGCYQALEAIKIAADIGSILSY